MCTFSGCSPLKHLQVAICLAEGGNRTLADMLADAFSMVESSSSSPDLTKTDRILPAIFNAHTAGWAATAFVICHQDFLAFGCEYVDRTNEDAVAAFYAFLFVYDDSIHQAIPLVYQNR